MLLGPNTNNEQTFNKRRTLNNQTINKQHNV